MERLLQMGGMGQVRRIMATPADPSYSVLLLPASSGPGHTANGYGGDRLHLIPGTAQGILAATPTSIHVTVSMVTNATVSMVTSAAVLICVLFAGVRFSVSCIINKETMKLLLLCIYNCGNIGRKCCVFKVKISFKEWIRCPSYVVFLITVHR